MAAGNGAGRRELEADGISFAVWVDGK